MDVSCIEDFIWHVGDIGYMDDSYAHSPVRLYGTWAGGSAAMNLLIWHCESYGIYRSLLDITRFHDHHDYYCIHDYSFTSIYNKL